MVRGRSFLGALLVRVVLLASPLLLFAAFELVLRLARVGYDPHFFVPIDGATMTTNDRFGWRFFAPSLARTPAVARFAAKKPPGTFRVFVLGESAAMGTPDAAFGLARHLEILLRAAAPDRPVEVIDAAMTAINSHVVVTIAEECARYEPDLFVVYMGNNEVVGPYGPGTVFQAFQGSRALIRANLAVRGTRVGQLLHRALARIGGPRRTAGQWRGMEMFLDRRVTADDPRLAAVVRHFEANLEGILDAAASAEARVIFSTVAVNLRDCAPFASVGEEDRSANAHFVRGRELLASGKTADARAELELARDLDALRFRADSALNASLRRRGAGASGATALTFVDADRVLSSDPLVGDGIPGDELFYEHVHFRFGGNYRLARVFFDAIHAAAYLPGATSAAPLGEYEVAEALAFTRWSEWTMADAIAQTMARPPFTGQLQQEPAARARAAHVDSLGALAHAPATLRASLATVRMALARRPDDLFLLGKLGELLMETGDHLEATKVWRRLLALRPGSADIVERLGTALFQMGYVDQAVAQFREVVALNPDQAEMQFRLGRVLEAAGEVREAREHYARALAIDPSHEEARQELGP